MPCCGICGNQGHNRRTCQQWQILEAMRHAEEEVSMIHTPQATVTDINYTPVLFETPNDRNVSRSLFEELENIDLNTLFLDTDSDLDSLPELISTYSLDDSMDKTVYLPLVNCVEEPCQATDCPICMEDLKQTDLIITRCGHQFHGTCMLQHMKKYDNCPLCRGVLFTKAIAI